jgi:PHD/YefM family antitoxin component YafN of YafNO toxin-antitoxin module
VFITNRGKPELVLLSIEEYRKITHTELSLYEALYPKDGLDIDLEVPRFKDLPREIDFS